MKYTSTEADALIDQEFAVLDRGEITLLDYMGTDKAIVDAARVSVKGLKKVSDDESLIRRLVCDRHTSPLEMVEFKFRAKMPIFVARQWIRHRTANVNEMSARYTVVPDEVYVPDRTRIQGQSMDNKQGSDGSEVDEVAEALMVFDQSAKRSVESYHDLLDKNVSRELARGPLTVFHYTEWIWKIDLHNLMHFLRLRLDPHAQWEIRQYAEVMHSMAWAVAPMTMRAFRDYSLEAMHLSRMEVEALAGLFGPLLEESMGGKLSMGMLDDAALNPIITMHLDEKCSKSERSKFGNKLRRLASFYLHGNEVRPG